jgi:hypothetical protein
LIPNKIAEIPKLAETINIKTPRNPEKIIVTSNKIIKIVIDSFE